MAYTVNEQFQSAAGRGSGLRVIPRLIQPKTIAAVGAAPTYANLTPMAFNTSTLKWVVWANGGSNGTGTIKAFVWAEGGCATDASNDVICNLLMAGDINLDDIVTPSGETLSNLKAALRTGLRENDLIIEGLDQFR